ncbi:MAG: DUF481 domain-containing protein [Rhodothermales bacterium]|nr:DUF481 domain-containing protein [Rhodothermales bacterium]
MIRFLLLAAILTLGVTESIAQVNTERLRSDKDGTSGSVDASVSVRRGNSDLLDVSTGIRLDHKDKRNYAFLVGRVSYGTNNSTTYSNSAFAHLRYNRELSSALAIEVFGQLQRDGFTLLQLRALLGAGIRVQYVKNDRLRLAQGSSLMYENERLDAAKVIVHPNRIETARWSNYVTLAGSPVENLTLVSTTYVQSALSDFGDVRIVNDASVAVSLSSRISLTTTLSFRYDSKPPDNIESADLVVRNGLRISL